MVGSQASRAPGADHDDVCEPIDWSLAVEGIPPRKHDVHIRIDEDVLDWFRQAGGGYQNRINDVLRAFMESRSAPRASRQLYGTSASRKSGCTLLPRSTSG
jgi:uncharacterized protein (DUF4415 family)